MNICQSCGMPMENQELNGKNKDGSVNTEYCVYCYPNGEFNKPDETLEEMVETCVPFLVREGFTEEGAKKHLESTLKSLKRWV
ncbi:zinc ribbon domain-containing protein [Clostridium cellulovorans]|uniref:Putative zinc ribbon domain-containing protein n=1 Tax=Clostridium cellulovorans (strain ATCC 35296 / DSM 3052 / OCM 3 / 743B) TaxID=573061 RepID=D9SND6_CLOC7|nr:zinc ribbon domain-containing protein [Clostridium cellulovorans]ADL53928.1 hypothetical protein Clocel_4267 [Clostridium cellulovorans 743B]